MEGTAIDKPVHRVRREDLSAGGPQQLLDVLAADREPAPRNAGDDLEFRAAIRRSLAGNLRKVLDPRDLVPRGPVIFADLGLDHDAGIELRGYHEVRGLIEARQAFGALGLAERNDLAERAFSILHSSTSPRISLTESRWPAKGLPRKRS